jgi:Zn finger protein HypA/HybF involved in hydrogenase expression
VTSVERVCQSCRNVREVGGHRLYRGAGLVLRCPVCGDIAASITQRQDAYVLSIRGTWRFSRQA